ncbi:uncharacterized protein K02A2.6-like [Ornithodoros turicata]|uniref:uncharacterized protein K02A2.6-like n=1 Tax=Ornithodoros turicata TaxID=34597 RepID=UPI003139A93D
MARQTWISHPVDKPLELMADKAKVPTPQLDAIATAELLSRMTELCSLLVQRLDAGSVLPPHAQAPLRLNLPVPTFSGYTDKKSVAGFLDDLTAYQTGMGISRMQQHRRQWRTMESRASPSRSASRSGSRRNPRLSSDPQGHSVATWTIIHNGQPVTWASRSRWNNQPRPLRGDDLARTPAPFLGHTLAERHPSDPLQPLTAEERRLLCPVCRVPEVHRTTHRRDSLHQARTEAARATNDVNAALATIRRLRPELLADPGLPHGPVPPPGPPPPPVPEEDLLDDLMDFYHNWRRGWDVVVPKPNGAVRVCGDFSVTVNPQLAIAQYPIPRPEELLAVLNGGEKFTKLDLSEAYLQMELDEEAKKMLVINTHKGLFQFNRMPFGIASAPAVFQRTMEQVISGLPSVACYLDDIIVTGRNDEEHLSNLSKVLARLQEFGFTLKREKCAFLQTQVEYLGHIVDADGFRPSPKKVSAILNMPPPNQVSELRSFLGMVQHYGKYLEGLADVCSPLNDLLKKGASWCWTSACVEAFESIKSMLASAKVLTHYVPTKEIFLAVDASSKGLGAVIYHRLHGVDRPIAHASKTLTVAETKYAQIEREALAIIFGVKKFHQYLWGRKFVLYTDHKPLTVIFGPSRGIPVTTASRLQRWALILMSYSFDIQFEGSSKIANADGLSRLPEGPDHEFDKAAEEGVFSVGTDEIFAVQDYHMSTLPVTAKDIAAATLEEPILTKVAKYVSRGWPGHVAPDLSPFYQRQTELTLHKGCILWGMRTVVPTKLRHKLLDILHDCHIGQSKMKMLARSYIWWPGLDKDIESRVRNCEQCSAVAAQEIPVPLHQWEQPDKAWHRLHADFAELHGKHYLIVIDAFSKWPDIIQMTGTNALKTISAFQDIFVQNGLPEVLVTDNGPPFTSQVFEDFLKQRGIHHVLTPPYHPQSNGLAENFVRTFKTALRRFEEGGDKDKLRDFLFKYRVTPHVTTGRPPCELLNNRHYRSLLDLVRPSEVTCSGRDSLARERQKRNYDRRTQDRQFSVDQGVWMLDNSKKGHWKTGTIVSKQGSVIFTVRDASGKVHRVHKDHLKRRETVESWRCSKNIPASDVRCRPAAIDDPNEEFPLPFPEVEGTSSGTFSQFSHSDRPHILSTEADHNVSHASTERPSAVTGSRRYPLRSRREPDRYGVA